MTLEQPLDIQLTIGAQRHEVMFKDGTAVTLHPVFDNGVPAKHHRAIKLPKGVTLVVDLRQLAPLLAADLCMAQAKDVPGTVFYNLRLRFGNAEQFVHQAILHGHVVLVDTRVAA